MSSGLTSIKIATVFAHKVTECLFTVDILYNFAVSKG